MKAPLPRQWDSLRQNRGRRLERAASLGLAGKNGKEIPVDRIIELLEAVIQPGDRVCLEGNNQKQADFLSESLADCSPERINRPQYGPVSPGSPEPRGSFRARPGSNRLDFSFSGPQGARLAKLVQEQQHRDWGDSHLSRAVWSLLSWT
jgi:malonate decarboxylase alpha subunit